MSTKQSTADFLLDQLRECPMRVQKMFGEYALYCDSKVVGFLCDDTLFIKPTPAGEALIGDVVMGHPYPGSKPYFRIFEDKWEDSEWLQQLVTVTAGSLPEAKKKK